MEAAVAKLNMCIANLEIIIQEWGVANLWVCFSIMLMFWLRGDVLLGYGLVWLRWGCFCG
jgi:hypothetical protein